MLGVLEIPLLLVGYCLNEEEAQECSCGRTVGPPCGTV